MVRLLRILRRPHKIKRGKHIVKCDSEKNEHFEVQNIRSMRWNNLYLDNWNKNYISFETTVYTHVSLNALANVALTYCLIQKHSSESPFYL